MGEIDYLESTINFLNENGKMEKLSIMRATDEKRRRPDAIRRNDKQYGGQVLDESINDVFIHNTNLEWLSLNWRK